MDEIRQLVNKLKRLLDDPQPGLFTWTSAVRETMEELVGLWLEAKAR